MGRFGEFALGAGVIAAAVAYGSTERASDAPQGPDRASIVQGPDTARMRQELDATRGPIRGMKLQPGETDADWCNRQGDDWEQAGFDTTDMNCNGKSLSYWRTQRRQGA